MSDMQDKFPFVDLANAEHRRVRAIIRSIENALRFGRKGEATRVAALLGDLVDELRRHYVKENEGGLLEEATCRVPSLAALVAPVMAAWPAMVARILALQGMVRDKVKEDGVSKSLGDMIHRALLDVASLEASEDEILGSAFGVNLENSGPDEERV